MTDELPCGYRFEFTHIDADVPDSAQTLQYIAVERSHEAAVTQVIALTGGDPNGVRLLDYGADVLAEAKRLGISNGQARAL